MTQLSPIRLIRKPQLPRLDLVEEIVPTWTLPGYNAAGLPLTVAQPDLEHHCPTFRACRPFGADPGLHSHRPYNHLSMLKAICRKITRDVVR